MTALYIALAAVAIALIALATHTTVHFFENNSHERW